MIINLKEDIKKSIRSVCHEFKSHDDLAKKNKEKAINECADRIIAMLDDVIGKKIKED
jgi:hypothetical protein